MNRIVRMPSLSICVFNRLSSAQVTATSSRSGLRYYISDSVPVPVIRTETGQHVVGGREMARVLRGACSRSTTFRLSGSRGWSRVDGSEACRSWSIELRNAAYGMPRPENIVLEKPDDQDLRLHDRQQLLRAQDDLIGAIGAKPRSVDTSAPADSSKSKPQSIGNWRASLLLLGLIEPGDLPLPVGREGVA
jgi:hypothetical protein